MASKALNYRADVVSLPDVKPSNAVDTIRVLHLDSGNLYGGVETILVTLARLRDLCPAIEPCFALCHEGRLSDELVEAGVAVHILGKTRISRPWTVWRARRRLREILRREQFDIVICHMPWSLAVFGKAIRAEGNKLGFWAHAFHEGRNWLERLARHNRPDIAIGNSYFTAGGVSNLFPQTPSQVVYPPVSLIKPADAGEWRADVRREQAADKDTVVIIQVSRLEACKGHFVHLHALAQLRHLRTHWVCWMAGGPQNSREEDYLQRLQHAAVDLGISDRIRFLGQRTDVPRLLAAADIFCQPNIAPDSFGISFVEALWMGLPVVSTSLGGAKEVVDDSCGMLVKPDNPDLVAASLRELIENPELRQRLGGAGASRALHLCDPRTQMSVLNSVCRKVTLEAGQS
jgi:glycosyltransferase involved in cell wall biosynthesis